MTNTITRILVPTDFSVHADAAVEYAARLASRFDAPIELLHVIDDPFLSGAWITEALVVNASELLDTMVSEAKKRLTVSATALAATGIVADVAVVAGLPSTGIVEHAREGKFDLIVMGTHGRTGLAHALVGSVAERVLRTAPCPVLTLKGLAPSAHACREARTAIST